MSCILIKWPGRVHDSRIFCTSKINEMLRNGSIPSLTRVLVPDTDPVPFCVLGDPAYPESSQREVVHHKSNSLGGTFVLHTWLSNVPSADLREDLEH